MKGRNWTNSRRSAKKRGPLRNSKNSNKALDLDNRSSPPNSNGCTKEAPQVQATHSTTKASYSVREESILSSSRRNPTVIKRSLMEMHLPHPPWEQASKISVPKLALTLSQPSRGRSTLACRKQCQIHYSDAG
jgi:hypothetical protein